MQDAAKSNVEGKLAFGMDLVDTPGSMQVFGQMWIFFMQKMSLQVNVDIAWPRWYLRVFAPRARCRRALDPFTTLTA